MEHRPLGTVPPGCNKAKKVPVCVCVIHHRGARPKAVELQRMPPQEVQGSALKEAPEAQASEARTVQRAAGAILARGTEFLRRSSESPAQWVAVDELRKFRLRGDQDTSFILQYRAIRANRFRATMP